MNLTTTTELEAVNEMLFGIGESPLNTLDDPGVVDAVIARQILQSVSRSIQSRGWHWNTIDSMTLPLTAFDNEIILPPNVLKADSVEPDERINVIQRGNRLYDKKNNTYRFDRPIAVTMVEFLPFEELPQPARTFITYQAIRRFQQGRVGSDTLNSFQEGDEKAAWAALMQAETETLDANIFDSPDVSGVLFR